MVNSGLGGNKKRRTKLRFAYESLIIVKDHKTPIFRQIEEQMRDAIWQGRLRAGERLPSTRAMAKELGVARNTVINAYEQLHVEGFLYAVNGSGTRVSEHLPSQVAPTQDVSEPEGDTPFVLRLSRRSEYLMMAAPFAQSTVKHKVSVVPGDSRYGEGEGNPGLSRLTGSNGPRPFQAHRPSTEDFPREIWAQLLTRRARHMSGELMDAGDALGYFPLRQAIADYLGATRGISAQPEQIVVTAGTQQSFDLLAKLLLDPGDTVCVEDPGYTPASVVFESLGARVVDIPVDSEGVSADFLVAHAAKAKLAYVTPASHFPLGMTMSQARRRALLAWAKSAGALVLEDDYNGEYRYRGRPLTTLHAMAGGEGVVYLGSFSKLLFPGLRLGYMVVPKALASPLACARWLLDRHSQLLEQATLTDFINQGHFIRHLRRMRTLYAERQRALVLAAEKDWRDFLSVEPLEGGAHVIARLAPGLSMTRLMAAAKSENIVVSPVSTFSRRADDSSTQRSLIIGYIPYTLAQIRQSVRRLVQAYWAQPNGLSQSSSS